MHDPDTHTDLSTLRIYEGDELIFDGSDPSTYTICHDIDDFVAALAAGPLPDKTP